MSYVISSYLQYPNIRTYWRTRVAHLF